MIRDTVTFIGAWQCELPTYKNSSDKIPFYVLWYVSIILYLHYVEEELCRNSKLALSKEEAFIANSLFHETNVRSTLLINAIKVFPAYYKKVMASELTDLIGKMKDENGENWSNFFAVR